MKITNPAWMANFKFQTQTDLTDDLQKSCWEKQLSQTRNIHLIFELFATWFAQKAIKWQDFRDEDSIFGPFILVGCYYLFVILVTDPIYIYSWVGTHTTTTTTSSKKGTRIRVFIMRVPNVACWVTHTHTRWWWTTKGRIMRIMTRMMVLVRYCAVLCCCCCCC